MVAVGGVAIYRLNIAVNNFSAYFFVLFLGGNLFTEKEKYNVDILKDLMFCDRRIDFRKTNVLVAKEDEDLRYILKDFTNTKYNILCLIGENGEMKKIMSEREVFNTLMAN